MRRGARAVVAVIAFGALSGCKKKPPPAEVAGEASGSGSASPAPQRARPSHDPQPSLPALELAEDPKRAEKVALGHALFFDKRLSGHADRSCYSCHQNEDGNGGHDPLAIGSGDKPQARHSPVIWNVGYWRNAYYWDGRAKTLEANVSGAWGGGNMGAGGDTPEQTAAMLDAKAAELAKIAGYQPLFEAAFPGTAIKAEHVSGAIAEYMRTLLCNNTKFDDYAAGKQDALTDQQQAGLDLFLTKGKCITCHAPPFFSTAMPVDGGAYFNVGIGTTVPEDQVDTGRMKVTSQPTDWAAFKPPSLRNVTKSPPYFHDGSVATLEEAVRLMASGGIPNKNRTPLLEDTKLTAAEIKDLVAFLGSLECPGKLEAPKLP